jgi:DNA (cytosine-5)-methyltransferase 1
MAAPRWYHRRNMRGPGECPRPFQRDRRLLTRAGEVRYADGCVLRDQRFLPEGSKRTMARSSQFPGHLCAEQLASQGAKTIISAGFPCQDISLAGEGAGLAGSRSGLVWPLLRTIRMVRPFRAVLENVAALLSRGLGAILGRMAEIGYDAEWHCIPASAVGAPHQRDRIWIIATDAGSDEYESHCAPLSGEIAAQLSLASANAAAMFGTEIVWSEPDGDFTGLGEVADASGAGLQGPGHVGSAAGGRKEAGQFVLGSALDGRQWSAEPAVGRVADGVPNRVDRLRTLGNAVVPQIPEIIGRAIMNAFPPQEQR